MKPGSTALYNNILGHVNSTINKEGQSDELVENESIDSFVLEAKNTAQKRDIENKKGKA